MLVVILISLPAVLAFCALAVNIAWMQLTRAELRASTDAAARAGSRTLSMTQDVQAARAAAATGARLNKVGGESLLIDNSDVEFGRSTASRSGAFAFTPLSPDSKNLNSVRVTGRRDYGSSSGSLSLLFDGFFDRTTFEPVKVATATHMDRDIMLVLDRSVSMWYPNDPNVGKYKWFFDWTYRNIRINALRSAVGVFLTTLDETIQEEQVGVVSYSEYAQSVQGLTTDYESVRRAVGGLRHGGNTAIGRGLERGLQDLLADPSARPLAARTIVILTDGWQNRGIWPTGLARTAHEDHGVTVHTITFGPGAGIKPMMAVARAGGGKHWHAADPEALREVFAEVADNLPTLMTE